jgi:pimeloyl-ACP methyl ester carboxylesterase
MFSVSSALRRLSLAALAAAVFTISACGGGNSGADGAVDSVPILSDEEMLPIVFVHGVAGSAQQYQTQAMRFVANGYPPERIRAFEYNGGLTGVVTAATGGFSLPLLNFINDIRDEFGVDQVYLVGHSLGTVVSLQFLTPGLITGLLPGIDGPSDVVAKYIAIDGAIGPVCPGLVPCLGIYDGDSTPLSGPNRHDIQNQAHVEVATSAESFVAQFRFLFDKDPAVVDVKPQRAPVEISGRAVNFPDNTGRAGATLDIWEIDDATGHRRSTVPHASMAVADDGSWGPVTVDPQRHYEKVLSSPGAPPHHFYYQRYPRSTRFVRLLSGPPDGDTPSNTHTSDDHTALLVLRHREWFATHDSGAHDVLEISTRSPGAGDQPVVNVISDFVGDGTLGLHIHDAEASPGETTGEPLPYFPDQPFQTGIDVYMPATDPPDGTITIRNLPRGDASRPQVIRVPNWASSGHRIGVLFNDYVFD